MATQKGGAVTPLAKEGGGTGDPLEGVVYLAGARERLSFRDRADTQCESNYAVEIFVCSPSRRDANQSNAEKGGAGACEVEEVRSALCLLTRSSPPSLSPSFLAFFASDN